MSEPEPTLATVLVELRAFKAETRWTIGLLFGGSQLAAHLPTVAHALAFAYSSTTHAIAIAIQIVAGVPSPS